MQSCTTHMFYCPESRQMTLVRQEPPGARPLPKLPQIVAVPWKSEENIVLCGPAPFTTRGWHSVAFVVKTPLHKHCSVVGATMWHARGVGSRSIHAQLFTLCVSWFLTFCVFCVGQMLGDTLKKKAVALLARKVPCFYPKCGGVLSEEDLAKVQTCAAAALFAGYR